MSPFFFVLKNKDIDIKWPPNLEIKHCILEWRMLIIERKKVMSLAKSIVTSN